MKTTGTQLTRKAVALSMLASLAACALLLTGCGHEQTPADGSSASASQSSYATPDEAVKALVAALENYDAAALGKLLGPGTDSLIASGDPVADKQDRAEFLAAFHAKNSVSVEGDQAVLVIGDKDWPMPIPLVKRDGRWQWDGAAGADEVVYRRVGANELDTIDVMRGFVDAQNEYASVGRDGDPPGIYALKLISDEGLHNGLYWPVADGEPPSPAGPFVAAAAEEGYRAGAGGKRSPYHGYYFRMLYAQGPNANGGARDYFRNGLLTEGFALIAWPADYGSSGVQTFIVNQDGVVFQKDLGENTATVVETVKLFDPDSSWTAVAPPAGAEPAAAQSTEASPTR